MSRTIDEKVVSMQFDNSNFERNVRTSMSTLDKLKHSLKLDGASKSLENVSAAAGRVDMGPLSRGVETVNAKFSALQVMAVTTLANITNSAVDAGKRLASAFTIDPIKTGFQEYETQINAVQTILANTESKGSTLQDVKTALAELNTYADQTIYNFTEMTRNIGTFTAAGVDLDTSVSAIKGIANVAAVSGSTSQQASTAMYQLSQALAAGTVKLMDWNSVVNAGMGGQIFQDALKETARVMHKTSSDYTYDVDSIIEKNGSFRESLQEGWLTSEVLTQTLAKFTGDLSEAQLKSMGYTEEQIKGIIKMGQTANDAATKVKTFTQMLDALKEAAQSGWARSWEIVIGDFEEARELWSKWATEFSNIIGGSANDRNAILFEGLGSNWDKLIQKINDAGVETDAFEGRLSDVLKSNGHDVDSLVEEYGSLEKAFTEGAVSSDLLKQALSGVTESVADLSLVKDNLEFGETGDDIKQAQTALKELGYDLGTFGEQADGLDGIFGDVTKSAVEAFQAANNLKVTGIVDEETLAALKEATSSTKELTGNYDELIDSITKKGGRVLLLESLDNAFANIKTVMATFKKAWNEIFYPGASDEDIIHTKAERLYKFAEAVHSLSEKLKISDETADKLKRTFKGLFAVIDIIRTVVGGAFTIGLKILGQLLGMVDLNVLDVTAAVGDAVVAFRDWLFENNILAKGLETVITVVKKVYVAVRDWIKEFLKIPSVQSAVSKFKEEISKFSTDFTERFSGVVTAFKAFFNQFKDMDKLSLSGIGKVFVNLKNDIVRNFSDIDISFDGFKDALVNFKDSIFENLGKAGEKFGWIGDKLKGFIELVREKLPAAISIGMGVLTIVSITKFADAIDKLGGPFGAITDILENVAEGLKLLGKSISKYIKAKAFEAVTVGVRNLAISVLILAGALAILSNLDQEKLRSAVISLSIMIGLLTALALAMSLIEKFGGSFSKGSTALLMLAGSILILVLSLKMLEGLDPDRLVGNITALMVMTAGLAIIVGVLGKLAPTLSSGSTAFILLAFGLLTMVKALKEIDSLHMDNVGTTMMALIGILITMKILIKMAKSINLKSAVGVIAVVVALRLLVGVIKEISKLDPKTIGNSLFPLVVMMGTIAILMRATKRAGEYAIQGGVGIMAISVALLIMVRVIKKLAEVSQDELNKAVIAIAQLLIVFGAVVALSKFAGKHAVKAGVMLVLMAGALLILTGIIHLLKDIDPDGLKRAVAAISVLELMFGGLIAVTKLAQDCKATLIILAVVLGLLTVSIYLLSKIDTKSLVSSVASLSAVMLAFAALIASTKFIKTTDLMKSLGVIGGLVLVVGALAGLILLLSKCEPGSTIEIAGSLSILVLSVAGACAILSKAGPGVKKAIPAAFAMSGVIAVLAIILLVMDKMEVGETLELATSLSVLLLALSGACVILSKIGPLGTVAAKGALSLLGVLGIVSAVILAVGGIVAAIPGSSEFLDTMITVLEKIGYALGSFFGGIAGGFSSGALSGLPEIGTYLSEFMENAKGFFDELPNVKSSALDGVKTLAEVLLILQGVSFTDKLLKMPFQKDSIEKFKEDLPKLGEAIIAFSDTVSKDGAINTAAVETAVNAASIVAKLAESIPKSGVIPWLIGEKDLGTFGNQLADFGTGIVSYSKAVSAEGAINTEAVSVSVTAANMLVALADTIPDSGLIPWITGEKNLGTFGAQLAFFGAGITSYSKAVSAEGAINTEAVSVSVTAANMLVALADTIPDSGLIPWITGEKNLGTFGSQLALFGAGIVSYSKAVSEEGAINTAAIIVSVAAGTALCELANAIPESGLIKRIVGEQNIGTFGDQLADFGKGIAKYSKNVVDLDVGAVTRSVGAVRSIIRLNDVFPEDYGSYKDFGDAAKKFGEKIKDYGDSASEIDSTSISNVNTSIMDLIGVLNSISRTDTSGVDSFVSGVNKLGNLNVSSFAESINSGIPKIRTAASNMMTAFSNAVKAKTGQVTQAFAKMVADSGKAITSKRSLFSNAGKVIMDALKASFLAGSVTLKSTLSTTMDGCVATLRTYYDDFYNAGSYVAKGFAQGISSSSYLAKIKAKAMAEAAITAAEKAAGIQSPSKVFHEIGYFVVKGFANGLEDYTPIAETASNNLGKSVVTAMQDTLGINSPSKVTRDEVGRYIVDGIAEGITEDMSAEEAASQKAQNIVNAFKTELDKFDLDSSTSDLEYQLWEKLNGNASGPSKSAEKARLLANKLQNQNQKVQLAKAEYEATLAELGATSEQTQEAYNKLLKEQISFIDLSTELKTAQQAVAQSNMDAANQYQEFINENQEFLLSQGYSLEEIQKAAADKTGYSLDTMKTDMTADVTEAVETAMATVQTTYAETAKDTFGSLLTEFSDYGSSYATAIGQGIQNGGPAIIVIITSMMEACVAKIKSQQAGWVEAGGYLVDGFIQGIRSNTERAVEEAAAMAKAASDALGTVSTAISVGGSSSYTPTITPVVDMSNAKISDLRLSPKYNLDLISTPINSTAKIVAESTAAIDASNKKVVESIDGLRSDLNSMNSNDNKEVSLYVDSTKLASSIAKPMNRQLSILSKRGAYSG